MSVQVVAQEFFEFLMLPGQRFAKSDQQRRFLYVFNGLWPMLADIVGGLVGEIDDQSADHTTYCFVNQSPCIELRIRVQDLFFVAGKKTDFG